jgi:hypothetical protein
MALGVVMVMAGLPVTIIFAGGPYRFGWPLLAVGISLIVKGRIRQKRASTQLPQQSQVSTEAPEKREPPKGAYDY